MASKFRVVASGNQIFYVNLEDQVALRAPSGADPLNSAEWSPATPAETEEALRACSRNVLGSGRAIGPVRRSSSTLAALAA
jgi:hypothetical protein